MSEDAPEIHPKVAQELQRLTNLAQSFDMMRLRAWLDMMAPDAPLVDAFLAHCMTHARWSHAQLMQDLFVDFVLGKEAGTFVEFGAADGLGLSNTLYLERHRGWNGVLAEPARVYHPVLRSNGRGCIVDTRCVWTQSGAELTFNETEVGALSTIDSFSTGDMHARHRETGNRYQVETVSLDDLLQQHLPDAEIDYLSIDTEGSELDILLSFGFGAHRPKIITAEHNYTDSRAGILQLLLAKGYLRVFRMLSMFDDWYVDETLWNELSERYGRAPVPL